MASRADKISGKQVVPVYYSDFTDNFDLNLVTGQLRKLTNEESVKQSIINLVLTNQGERFYRPLLGSKVQDSLFDLIDDPLTIEDIKDSIVQVITDYEPRANLLQVDIVSDPDHNAYTAIVVFSLINISGVQSVTINLSRVR